MRTLWLLVLLLLAAFSAAQPTAAEILRAPAKKIDATELPQGYRAVVFGQIDPGNLGAFYAVANLGSSSTDGEKSLLLYSLVGVSFVDPDEFAELLEGKRPRIRSFALDTIGMTRLSSHGADLTPRPIFIEGWIERARISQWSPRPSVTRETILKAFGPPEPPDPDEKLHKTLGNIKQAALAITMYCSDSDDVFPAADSTPEVRQMTFPYTKNETIWKSLNPEGGRILYNTSLSRTAITKVETPAETLLLWEDKPWPDGRRVVAYVDGHGEIVDGQDWTSLWNREQKRRVRARAEAIAAAPRRKPKRASP